MVEQMSSLLLQRSGQYSFYCGDYPLWSLGGCDESDESALILFLLNYRVAKGLRHNKEVGLAYFLESSSLNLICGLPNSDESDLTNCNESQQLAWAFNATSELPLGGLTSTLTAAIVLDFLHPDKIFKYESGPPIFSSSVIILIAMELVVAFGTGSSKRTFPTEVFYENMLLTIPIPITNDGQRSLVRQQGEQNCFVQCQLQGEQPPTHLSP